MNIRHLSFRLLQVYVQVVRLGNISAAARNLHLTQPTVSLQLKKLSEAVGEPLFDSRQGKCTPPMSGKNCIVRHVMYSAVSTTSRFFAGSPRWLLWAYQYRHCHHRKYVLPRILGAFYRLFPQVTVTLNVGNRSHILERFSKQEDDLYLFSHPPSGPNVQACRILKNPLLVIAPVDHRLAHAKKLSFADVRDERFLIREPGSATRMMFEAWLSSQGIDLSNTMQIESNEAIRLSVASG